MLNPVFPLVSCVVPCFNGDIKILQESLISLRNQSFKNFECILIDESTDEKIINACKSFCETDKRFRYIHPPMRLGLAASLNIGIESAKGKFIARFDSDDICNFDRLALQVEFLDLNPEVGIVGGALDIINNECVLTARRVYPLEHSEIEKRFIFSNSIAHPTVMFRKSVLSISGGAYDPSFKYSEDLDFWLRLLNCKIQFANLAKPLIKYRQQQTNRNIEHWNYNLKARIKNFSSPHRFKKTLGILGIMLWVLLPTSIQRALFKAIQFRKV
jgi:glycosyltransferase involved in cell wall biosynthesis